MTYKDFTDHFLRSIAYQYKAGALPFHGLIDFDLWQKLFPDNDATGTELRWNNIKFEAHNLNDRYHSLLIVYILPLFNIKNEIKLIGIRICPDGTFPLAYYQMQRPDYQNEHWDIFQYSFEDKEILYLDKNCGLDSIDDFCRTIEQHPSTLPSPHSIFTFIKNGLNAKKIIKLALSS